MCLKWNNTFLNTSSVVSALHCVMEMTRIGIIGGTGYTGSELARILCTHPDVEIAAMTSRQNAGVRVAEVHPFLSGYVDIDFTERISDTKDLDLVFVATPHGVAMNEVPALLDQGIKAIDLSGDYRMHDVAVYEKWYGHTHTDVDNLQRAVYGLPEFFRDEIRGLPRRDPRRGPGCQPWMLRHVDYPRLRPPAEIGPGGGGRHRGRQVRDVRGGHGPESAHPSLDMRRVDNPLQRRHAPPHSGGGDGGRPFRGLVHEGHVRAAADPDSPRHPVLLLLRSEGGGHTGGEGEVTQEEIDGVYRAQYGGERFVHYVKEPSIRAVVGSNHAQVSSRLIGDKVVAFGVVDNLVKGAAGQAVQCMNLMLNLNESAGLDTPGLGV